MKTLNQIKSLEISSKMHGQYFDNLIFHLKLYFIYNHFSVLAVRDYIVPIFTPVLIFLLFDLSAIIIIAAQRLVVYILLTLIHTYFHYTDTFRSNLFSSALFHLHAILSIFGERNSLSLFHFSIEHALLQHIKQIVPKNHLLPVSIISSLSDSHSHECHKIYKFILLCYQYSQLFSIIESIFPCLSTHPL